MVWAFISGALLCTRQSLCTPGSLKDDMLVVIKFAVVHTRQSVCYRTITEQHTTLVPHEVIHHAAHLHRMSALAALGASHSAVTGTEVRTSSQQ